MFMVAYPIEIPFAADARIESHGELGVGVGIDRERSRWRRWRHGTARGIGRMQDIRAWDEGDAEVAAGIAAASRHHGGRALLG
jgi:hypothetical protein